MPLRFLFFLIFSALLNAQQNTVRLELDPSSFPKGCVFRVEMELQFSAIDTKRMLDEGRRAITDKDYILKQTSTNYANWTISYDKDGNPIIKGSPKIMDFNFSKPISLSSDVRCLVKFDYKLQLKNGRQVVEAPFEYRHQHGPDDTYVLKLTYMGTEKHEVLFKVALASKKMLQDMLEGKGTISGSESRPGTHTITVPTKVR